jgi:hypothetical protein
METAYQKVKYFQTYIATSSYHKYIRSSIFVLTSKTFKFFTRTAIRNIISQIKNYILSNYFYSESM